MLETANPIAPTMMICLDGREPDAVYAPSTEAEIVGSISQAVESGSAIVPVGGGTSISIANTLRAESWAALCSTGYAGIADYSAEDMVVTVRTGTRMSELQTTLESQKQWLPLDAPNSRQATVGGVVACNATGLYRAMYGAPRDRVLAMRVVLADGAVVQCGAKVVKNVAGYDMGKLFCGSHGTLGFISEITFKTSPLPEAKLSLTFRGDDPHTVAIAAQELHLARLQMAYLLLETTEGDTLLHIGLHGGKTATEWQRNTVTECLQTAGLNANAAADEEQLRNGQVDSDGIQFRLSAKPSSVPELNSLIARSGWYGRVSVEMGTALINVPATGLEAAKNVAKQLSEYGQVRWEGLPVEWRPSVDVWGEPGSGAALMGGIKKALDPHSHFSPGRFVNGI